jgi:hypothetical protein
MKFAPHTSRKRLVIGHSIALIGLEVEFADKALMRQGKFNTFGLGKATTRSERCITPALRATKTRKSFEC